MNSRDTYINSVRLQSSTNDAPAVRLRLAAILSAVVWHPPGVSPTAVLIVRHLADPKPGRVALGTASLRPDATWETAVRQTLAAFYQRAAHPEQGHIPPGAEAVLFADESELNACLALALAQGEARQHWWWQVPLRSLPAAPDAGITALFCEKAALLPATIHQLTKWRQASVVLNRLAEPQVKSILDALAAAYALPQLLAMPTSPSISNNAENWQENGRSPTPDHAQTTNQSKPPWHTLQNWHSLSTGLTTTQTYLWGWAMSLQANPSKARQPEFRHAAQQWLAALTQKLTSTAPQQASASRTQVTQASPLNEKAGTAVSPPPTNDEKAPTGQSFQKAESQPDDTSTPVQDLDFKTKHASFTQESTAQAQINGFQPDSVPDATKTLADLDESPSGGTAVPPATTPRSSSETQLTPTPTLWTDGLSTKLAGAFYLINVMQRLQLPACFDDTWELSHHLPPWAVLELLTRGLVNAENEEVADDPLWLALAELDDRLPGMLPDFPFPAPQTFALPAHWLTQIELNQSWIWASNGRYFRIWSEQSFLVCQQPVSPGKQTIAEARAWLRQSGLQHRPILVHGRFADAPIHPVDSPLLTNFPVGLTRWLGFVLPYIQYWLQNTIDMADDILQQNGRLYLSSSHVDVVMPLASINLALRLAGLDLDPGWLPDYGRVIQFHFDT